MNRRNFVRSAGAVTASLAFPQAERLLAEGATSDGWRTFEVKTRVEILKSPGATRVWLPASLSRKMPFQKTLSNEFRAEGGAGRIVEVRADGLAIVAAEFPAGVKPVLTLTSRVATRNYAVDLSAPRRGAESGNRAELEHFLRPTKLLPTDGIVRATATEITRGAETDIEKARAIYEWIVDNTFRDSKIRGCGRGDIRFMLEQNAMGGKCADINALYVGMARSVGIPARHIYGLRINKSDLGYKSLGLSTDKATKGQHCRVEVYLRERGWMPVDPADVRKVVLEEPPGNRPISDEMVSKARERLFGSWEMNWMAFNYAHDVELPGSSKQPLVYFMYPQAETAEGRVDPFDPDSFKYEITTKEITA